jgi:hypothetical protein
MAPRKIDFALAERAVITQFAEAAERIAELDAIYMDSGYDSSGSDPIVDSDLTGHDMTAAQLTAVHTFAGQLNTFITPSIAAAINKFRDMA